MKKLILITSLLISGFSFAAEEGGATKGNGIASSSLGFSDLSMDKNQRLETWVASTRVRSDQPDINPIFTEHERLKLKKVLRLLELESSKGSLSLETLSYLNYTLAKTRAGRRRHGDGSGLRTQASAIKKAKLSDISRLFPHNGLAQEMAKNMLLEAPSLIGVDFYKQYHALIHKMGDEKLRSIQKQFVLPKLCDISPPSANEVETLLQNLLLPILNNQVSISADPYIEAAYIQAVLGWIHPWGSGNGRTLRVISAYYLADHDVTPWVMDDRNEKDYTQCHQEASPELAKLWIEKKSQALTWDQLRKNIVASKKVLALADVLGGPNRVMVLLPPRLKRILRYPFLADIVENSEYTLPSRLGLQPSGEKIKLFDIRRTNTMTGLMEL